MASNNSITLVGRAGMNLELKRSSADVPMTNVNIAVRRSYKNSEGKYDTDWFRVEFYGKQAEIASSYIKSGTLFSVEGEGKFNKYDDKYLFAVKALTSYCSGLLPSVFIADAIHMFRMDPAVPGVPCFFKRTYHDHSASLL